jgi:hypothetical protein
LPALILLGRYGDHCLRRKADCRFFGDPFPSVGYRETLMKWMRMYLAGYSIVLVGLISALWKLGVLERVGPAWTAIGVVIAIGLGVMVSVSGSGTKETVEIDQKR